MLAVNSASRKLKHLCTRIVPIFEDFGFTPPSAGVIACDLSEKIEKAIIQHCESFTKGKVIILLANLRQWMPPNRVSSISSVAGKKR